MLADTSVLYWQHKYHNGPYANGVIFPDGELSLIKFKKKQVHAYTCSHPRLLTFVMAFLEKPMCVKIV